MGIEKFTISRDDSVYECFPSLTQLKSGRVILVYRESEGHSAKKFTRVVVRTSDDKGKTWSDRKVLVATEQAGGCLLKYNCPKVQQVKDGRVLIVCDVYPVPPGECPQIEPHNEFFFSSDNGETWSKPQVVNVHGIMPDEVIELDNGDWLLATQKGGAQLVNISSDQGKTWGAPIVVAKKDLYTFCEASIIKMPGGELVCYMRENRGMGRPIYKCISTDGGKTWQGPFETLMDAGHRPVAHLTKSGKVLITYRHQPGGTGVWAKNTFAFLESVHSALETDRSKQSGITLPLDHDRNKKSDGGYTGWVETSPGEFLMVNYIMDDAPMAYIRGYRFSEKEF